MVVGLPLSATAASSHAAEQLLAHSRAALSDHVDGVQKLVDLQDLEFVLHVGVVLNLFLELQDLVHAQAIAPGSSLVQDSKDLVLAARHLDDGAYDCHPSCRLPSLRRA